MEFSMDLKSKVGPITAVVILAGTVFWMMGVDEITQTQHSEPGSDVSALAPKVSTEKVIKKQVQAQSVSQSTMSNFLSLSGTTQPSKELTLTSGLAGKVKKIHTQKGQFIKQGLPILNIDTRTLEARIAQEKALVKQRQMQLDGAIKLQQQNYSSAVNQASAEADLAAAKASLKASQVDLENAKLVAPFSGVLNTLDVEEGQLIPQNQVVGEFVSINPLSIEVNIPQKQLPLVKEGLPAHIELSTGESADGKIKYISSVADSGTRSILVEIEVPNENNRIPAGITAHVTLALPDRKAHSFSAALLTLDDDGRTAVKTLNLNNEVVISPVEVLKSERGQVWVDGLPPNVNLITVGQGFTKEGDVVEAFYQNQ
ncbi:efflux RND transporter periplasmic adaptor subunit [Marinomonas agarivorans]|nr:efflux RND transporter periplasmic adaptor subunit [Marinomonas agarivorans]